MTLVYKVLLYKRNFSKQFVAYKRDFLQQCLFINVISVNVFFL